MSTPLREEDIRPAALMTAKQDCIELDRAFLLDRRNQWVKVNCPACDKDVPSPFGTKQGFQYVTCDACGTIYTNPRPSESLSHAFYAQSANYAYWNEHIFPATENIRRTRIFAPRASRVAAYCRESDIRSGTLVEVGAAFGTFCDEIRTHGIFDRIVAIEPTAELAQTCRTRGYETIEQPIEHVTGIDDADVVVAFEVLEHLFCPRVFVRSCRRLLKRGGLLIMTCPNVRGFDVATLGIMSNTFDHEHLNYFHLESLPMMLRSEGFVVTKVETPGQLDADLVRNQILAGNLNVDTQPLLRQVLVDRWNTLGDPFQRFLSNHQLSSHMWVAARNESG